MPGDLAIAVAITAVLLSIPAITQGELRGDAEALRTAALQHRANRDQLVSWQGRVSVTEHGHQWETRSTVTFLCDVRRGATRWHWRHVGGTDLGGAGVLDGLVTDGRFYHFVRDRQGHRTRNLVIKAAREVHPTASPHFLPTWFFRAHDPAGLDTRLLFYYENRRHRQNVAVVEHAGDAVALEIRRARVVNRYEIDLAQGGNLTAYLASEPGADFEWAYEWERVGRIWVPRVVQFTRQRQAEDGRTDVYCREFVWERSVVNEDIDPAEFTLKALGVRPGDTVYDNIADKTYTYAAEDTRSDKDAR